MMAGRLLHDAARRSLECAPGVIAIAFRVVLLFGLFAGPALVEAAEGDPRPPPGLDPGGPAIALISDGVDYMPPDIATRLARDGEGEPIALDLVDGDVRPYAPATSTEGTRQSRELLAAHPKARLVMARVSLAEPMQIARAAAFVTRTPAGVIAVAVENPSAETLAFLEQVAAAAPSKAFVLPPGAVPPGSAKNVIVATDVDNGRGADASAAGPSHLAFPALAAEIACRMEHNGTPASEVGAAVQPNAVCDPLSGMITTIDKTQF